MFGFKINIQFVWIKGNKVFWNRFKVNGGMNEGIDGVDEEGDGFKVLRFQCCKVA